MRILLLSQYFWPESFRIVDVAKTLAQKGVKVDILTGKPNYPQGVIFDGYKASGCQRETLDGNEIYRIPLRARGRSGVGLALNYLSFIFSGLVFGPWMLRGKKFDVIFVYAPSPILQALPAIFLGWLKGCPVVLWVQDLWPESLSATGHVKNKRVLKCVEAVVRYIYRKVDLLLVQSEAFVAPVSALASGTPVRYFPNSVDDSFSSPAAGSGLDLAGMDAAFPVLFAGNIGTAQAVEVIVEAAVLLRAHADIQFVVVGDGSRREWMAQQVIEQGLTNLHLPGRFPIETMPALMQKASALLVTLADQEIFRHTIPSKIQAYLAAGRPVLASLDGEGAKLISDAKAGVAVPAEDGGALARAVLQMYQSLPEEREKMGVNGAAYFKEHFEHDMLVDRLITILDSCVASKKGN